MPTNGPARKTGMVDRAVWALGELGQDNFTGWLASLSYEDFMQLVTEASQDYEAWVCLTNQASLRFIQENYF